MREMMRLFKVVVFASLIYTTVYFAVALALASLLHRPSVPRTVQGLGVGVTVLVPVALAAWWMFKKLRPNRSRREARAAAVAFGVSAPVSIAVALLFSTLIGAYAEGLGREPFFGLAGAFLGIVAVTALLTVAPCALALWITRRIGRADADVPQTGS